MERFRLLNVVGARPNMMKMAPLLASMRRHPDLEPLLVHTGQHYDYAMSRVFFEQLQMPEPDYNLEVGSGSHHAQTGEVMKRFGQLVEEQSPDMIVVVGDVNSTMACALVGSKAHIPVAHVEAGLRSNDRRMPEEINRIVTDAVSDLLFTTEEGAEANLRREGVSSEKVFFAGNLMIDSLVGALGPARRSPLKAQLGLQPRGYAVLTLHRPSNVDDPHQLKETLAAISAVSEELPVVFPVHPRTAAKIADSGFRGLNSINGTGIGKTGIWTLPPASYLDFLGLVDSARFVITDSGGIQEETTYLGVPCLTYRENTERPITVTHGTNRLVGCEPRDLKTAAFELLEDEAQIDGEAGCHVPPPLWDGQAAPRIVRILRERLHGGIVPAGCTEALSAH